MPLPQPPRLELTKITTGLRPYADEKKSAWVVFPHLRGQYMLPIMQLSRKMVPVWEADGSVSVDTKDRDPALAQLVDDFLLSISRKEAQRKSAWVGLAAYGAFLRLARGILLVNYDLTNEQLTTMLTLTDQEFGVLHQIIFRHCMGV